MPSVRVIRKVSLVLVSLWLLTSLVLISDLLWEGFFGLTYDQDDDQASLEYFQRHVDQSRKHVEVRKRFRRKCRTAAMNATEGENITKYTCNHGYERLDNPYDSQVRRGRYKHRYSDNSRGSTRRPAGNTTLALPKPVIVMGFPKAGTSSIFSFFKNQMGSDLRCQHWVSPRMVEH